MSTLNAKLDELKAELVELEKADATETVDMNPTEFAEHLVSEVAKAKAATGDERAARFKYVNELIDIGKNYKGPTPGAQSIPMYKDPAQSTHTTSAPSVPTTQPTGSNFSQDSNTVPPTGTPSAPSAGGMPPAEAGPSGAPFAGGNFAKAIDAKLDEIKSLVKSATDAAGVEPPAAEDAKPEDKTPTAKADAKPAEDAKPEDKTPTTKARDAAWPLDMNSKVGLGKAESEEEPEHFFGWDSGSALEAEHAANAAAGSKG